VHSISVAASVGVALSCFGTAVSPLGRLLPSEHHSIPTLGQAGPCNVQLAWDEMSTGTPCVECLCLGWWCMAHSGLWLAWCLLAGKPARERWSMMATGMRMGARAAAMMMTRTGSVVMIERWPRPAWGHACMHVLIPCALVRAGRGRHCGGGRCVVCLHVCSPGDGMPWMCCTGSMRIIQDRQSFLAYCGVLGRAVNSTHGFSGGQHHTRVCVVLHTLLVCTL
jgi:hypothetical protein